MKIIVTGCKGQLGTEIIKQLREGRSEIGPIPEKLLNATVIAVDLPDLDISNYKMVDEFIRRNRPDVIINCAAYTNVDGCEVNHDAAFKANALGPRNLAQAAEKTGARLVHVSTDYVFSGRENGGVAQDEATIPGPISAYGSTKLMGEKYVEQFCHRHFIVRTAWLYSYYGKNFVKTIVNAGKKFGKLEVVNDQCGNPTNAVDLAHEILQLLEQLRAQLPFAACDNDFHTNDSPMLSNAVCRRPRSSGAGRRGSCRSARRFPAGCRGRSSRT